MRHITLVIPTRNRYKKLITCIDSIDDPNIEILVVCDGDTKTWENIQKIKDSRIVPYLTHRQLGSVQARNIGIKLATDLVSWGVDDVIYTPNFFQNALKSYETQFPDGDGVLGFNVLNNRIRKRIVGQSKVGIGMVDQKWLDRYPEHQLFCPKYFHFSIQEVSLLGQKLNKLYLDLDLVLYHVSPMSGEAVDNTHVEARKFKNEDKTLYKQRKKDGILWGYNDK